MILHSDVLGFWLMTGLCASWMAPLRSVHIHVSVYGWLPLVVFVFVGFAAAYVLVSLMLAFTVRWCCDFFVLLSSCLLRWWTS